MDLDLDLDFDLDLNLDLDLDFDFDLDLDFNSDFDLAVVSHAPCMYVLSLYTVLYLSNRPKWSGRSAARAAVRAVRSGPLLIEYGTIPYHYR